MEIFSVTVVFLLISVARFLVATGVMYNTIIVSITGDASDTSLSSRSYFAAGHADYQVWLELTTNYFGKHCMWKVSYIVSVDNYLPAPSIVPIHSSLSLEK